MTMSSSEAEENLHRDLVELWKALGAGRAKDLKQAKTQVRYGDRFVGVGVDAHGMRHLLIPLNHGAETAGIWRSAAVVVDRRNLVGADGISGTWLVIRCLKPELNNVFARLAANVASTLPNDAETVLASTIETLDSWRELFGPATIKGLSAQSALGLLGELIVLRELAGRDPAKALAAWTGPHGGRHDFRWGENAIEAKATLTRVGRFITINGPHQLEAPESGNLYLSWVRFERAPSGLISIAALTSELTSLGVSTSALDDLLGRLGAGDMNDPEAIRTYSISEWLVWQVNAEFPKIIPQCFADGRMPRSVIDLNYVIDCSAAPPHPLEPATVHAVWPWFLNSGRAAV